MKIALIGAGLIGEKRLASLNKNDELIIVCDINKKRAKDLAKKYSSKYTIDYKDIINEDIDIVIISVVNKYLKNIAITMLKSGKHILCEKPLGVDYKESKKILDASIASNKIIKTGFNHRFHPSIIEAKKIIDQGKIGKILNIRANYGHGGRPGMEDEWRCSKDLCGGGELLDQGVHLIDLCRFFIEEKIIEVYGKAFTSFWDINVEDNSFFNLEFKNGCFAQCHVSWTNWKNTFSFEIFGSLGYLKMQGLGGSYGEETLEFGIRNQKGGVPNIKKFNYPIGDFSWKLEWQNFKDSIINKVNINGSGKDGYLANKIINLIYKSNSINKPVKML